jgi:hypothetical protein
MENDGSCGVDSQSRLSLQQKDRNNNKTSKYGLAAILISLFLFDIMVTQSIRIPGGKSVTTDCLLESTVFGVGNFTEPSLSQNQTQKKRPISKSSKRSDCSVKRKFFSTKDGFIFYS